MTLHTLKLASHAQRDLRRAAEAARQGRFDGLTVDAAALDEAGESASARREVRAILSRNGLAPAALQCALPGKGLSADADGDRVLDALRKAIDLCRGVGFACVACDLDAVPRSMRPAAKPKNIEPAMLGALILPTGDDLAKLGIGETSEPSPLSPREREHAALAADVLREVGEAADRAGVPVALGATLAPTIDLAALLAAVDCAMFFRELDLAATVTELADDVAGVVGALPAVLHVRGGDAQSSGGRSREVELGRGDVPLAEVASALDEADYAGFVTLPAGVSRRAWVDAVA